MDKYNEQFMTEAIRLATENVKSGKGGPFGAVVVKNGEIIGRGTNIVTSSNDPTAHAEVIAIRNACNELGSFHLTGCDIYSSCEPCPMCFGAVYWSRPDNLFFAGSSLDAADAGFDDSIIYEEIKKPVTERKTHTSSVDHADKLLPFNEWKNKTDKKEY